MNLRKWYRFALTLAVVAFIASMICAWLAAPGQMALVTVSALTVNCIGKSKENF